MTTIFDFHDYGYNYLNIDMLKHIKLNFTNAKVKIHANGLLHIIIEHPFRNEQWCNDFKNKTRTKLERIINVYKKRK